MSDYGKFESPFVWLLSRHIGILKPWVNTTSSIFRTHKSQSKQFTNMKGERMFSADIFCSNILPTFLFKLKAFKVDQNYAVFNTHGRCFVIVLLIT